LAILPSEVDFVTGLNQKRVWDHITNADHAQVTINFKDGVQASFVNSDLAAARKPKFYVLGTKGAIIGDWDESGEGAVADLPAIISVYGEDEEQQIVDYVQVEPYSFHKSLAALLTDGEPMSVNAQQSRDVVAIMQAAEASALKNGLPVTPSLLR
jgi:predicted dehydrogenase